MPVFDRDFLYISTYPPPLFADLTMYKAVPAKSIQMVKQICSGQGCRRLLWAGTRCGGMIAWAAHDSALQRFADAQLGRGSTSENSADHDLKKAVGSHLRRS